MAIALTTLVEEADRYLDATRFQDYCPNGLQVEGRPQVRRIVSGVTASQALVDAAIEAEADVLLVHHGYFWKNEDPRVIGMKQRRLKALLASEVSCSPIICRWMCTRRSATTCNWRTCSTSPSRGRSSSTIRARSAGGFAGDADAAGGFHAPAARNPGTRAADGGRRGAHPAHRLVHRAAQGYIDKALAAGVDAT